jgi:putative Mg2+ transporter-C (MgtC) family protein
MTLELQFVLGLRLVLAALLSMIIGLNRERVKGSHTAGLRTHMMVGIGSCLFTELSMFAFGPADGSRVASGIVTGIGFLGAGAILHDASGVHSLTTAAGIWATAAIGMAVATGAWFLAIMAAILVWTVLAILRRLEPHKRVIQPAVTAKPPVPGAPAEEHKA